LVVNEDPDAREGLARLLHIWGGAVDQVGEATEAVEALTRRSYDAVVIDGSGDQVSVEELARIIKDDLKQEKTLVVATGTTREAAATSGAERIDAYLSAPVRSGDLLSSLGIKEGAREKR